MMQVSPLNPEEEEIIRLLRSRRNQQEHPLPRLDAEEFRKRLKTRLGYADSTVRETMRKLDYVTRRYPGPRVVLTGTLLDLQASWKEHVEDLILKRKSSAVIRHHREAIRRYCNCAEIPWEPEVSLYEKRARDARSRRNQMIELPHDFLDRVRAIVHDVEYHKDPAVNAMFQYRARLNFKTAPRTPSEDNRLRLQDIQPERGVIVYRQGKIAGPEGDAVLVPREVFGLGADTLTAPTRKSVGNYLTHWRPRLLERAQQQFGSEYTHPYVWCGPLGTPSDPNWFRLNWSAGAKDAWPEFYPYLSREIGIIMQALTIIHELGHLDLERLIQWSGHEKLDNMRKYTRKARQLLREAGDRPQDLKRTIEEWRSI